MSKILVVGTGAWGTTLANILLENRHTVNMYGVEPQQLEDLKRGYNKEFFKGAKLHKIPHLVTSDFAVGVKDVEYILLSIPSKYIKPTLEQYKELIPADVVIINSSKGIDGQSGKNYFELIKDVLPNNPISAIVGPSFAIEVFHNQNTIVNAVCKDLNIAKKVGALFNNSYFITKPITDELGSSIFSALKNGLAVGCGMLYGLNASINTISAVITRGVQEIEHYVNVHQGEPKTAIEYCAIGDIYLTCSDDKSRNFRLGELIAKLGIKKALVENTYTVEGLEIIKDIHKSIKNDVEYILFNLLYEIVDNKIHPQDFINQLWKRLSKAN